MRKLPVNLAGLLTKLVSTQAVCFIHAIFVFKGGLTIPFPNFWTTKV